MKEEQSPSVSVVIPTLNAAEHLPGLFQAIAGQKPSAPDEIIIVDSGSTDNTRSVAQAQPNVKVVDIANFSHGRARNLGVAKASGKIIVLMTQDALPMNSDWLAKLLEPFSDNSVAAVYSRQVPREDAPPTERFFLNFHFPPDKRICRQKKPGATLSLTDVFFSNVSAAARKEMLTQYPFDETIIMSEDQQFARDVINAGFKTIYQPESIVVHSHRYSLATAFRRYFDSVYSLTVIFSNHNVKTSGSIGLRYLQKEFLYILRQHPLYLPYYFLYTLAKAVGTVSGHFAEKLPRSTARFCSLHKYHWKTRH